jgi:hypothetical protein
VALLDKALPLARSREEVHELGNMKAQSKAKLDGIALLQAAAGGASG